MVVIPIVLPYEDSIPMASLSTKLFRSKSIADLGMNPGFDIESNIVVLEDWDSLAVSKWPLSYRDDTRNWRLSNQKRFDQVG